MKNIALARLVVLAAFLTLFAGGKASAEYTYFQDFEAPHGTTGAGLNDGSFMVGINHTPMVFDWSAGWKALWLTPMAQGTLGAFFLPDLDPGGRVEL
jgi:hypothetical protein